MTPGELHPIILKIQLKLLRCGVSSVRRSIAQRRIVGGDEAGFGTFPWQAYIRIGTSRYNLYILMKEKGWGCDCRCGGSLINQWHVVTAGHCVARARPNQVTTPIRSADHWTNNHFLCWMNGLWRDCLEVRVTLGEYVLKSDVEPLPGRTYGATQIKVHPYFRFTPQVKAMIVMMIAENHDNWIE